MSSTKSSCHLFNRKKCDNEVVGRRCSNSGSSGDELYDAHCYEEFIPENDVMLCTLKNDVTKLTKIFENPEDPTRSIAKNQAQERNYYGKTAVQMACILGRIKVLTIFSKYDIDLQQATPLGYTLMHIAASWGQVPSLRFLDETFEVDWKVKTKFCETPEMIAVRYDKEECVNFIHKAIAKKNLKNCIMKVREDSADPEKSYGIKFGKDDKTTITNSCNERWDWANSCLRAPENEDDKEITLIEIEEKQKELQALVQAIIDKANAPPVKKKADDKRKGSNAGKRSIGKK